MPSPAPAPSTRLLFGSRTSGSGDVVVHEDHGVAVVAGLRRCQISARHETAAKPGMLRRGLPADARRLVPVCRMPTASGVTLPMPMTVTLDKLDGSSLSKQHGAIDTAIAEKRAPGLVRRWRTCPRASPTALAIRSGSRCL